MSNFLYAIAVLLAIIWGIAFIEYNAGPVIHILLVISVILILITIVWRKKIF